MTKTQAEAEQVAEDYYQRKLSETIIKDTVV